MVRFQELQVYQLAEQIYNEVWFIVQSRDFFAKNSVENQKDTKKQTTHRFLTNNQ